jgi:hypothetical protein
MKSESYAADKRERIDGDNDVDIEGKAIKNLTKTAGTYRDSKQVLP